MRSLILAVAIALGLASTLQPQSVRAQAEMIDGQVTKVDEPVSKITIRHGPIKRLGMDEGHTMVFAVQDPELLKQVKAGDRIKFLPDRVNGQFVVTKIQKLR